MRDWEMRLKKFNWLNIQKVPDDEYGIYMIRSKNVCIYIGKAELQSLRSRLIQHYTGSHNEKLAAWIGSSHPLFFAFEIVCNLSAINAKERNRIKSFAPITNKLLNKKEYQYGTISPRV